MSAEPKRWGLASKDEERWPIQRTDTDGVTSTRNWTGPIMQTGLYERGQSPLHLQTRSIINPDSDTPGVRTSVTTGPLFPLPSRCTTLMCNEVIKIMYLVMCLLGDVQLFAFLLSFRAG